MSEHSRGAYPPEPSEHGPILIDVRGIESARRSITQDDTGGSRLLTPAEREQLARDIADIEAAAAVLRTAQPALTSWVKPPPAAVPKPRSLWLLIGVLWLSTALVTAGAAVAFHSFVG
jgi:hypothetical protein